MNAIALLLLQTVAPAGPVDVVPPPRSLEAEKKCGPSDNGDIVVCAKPNGRSPYRLPLPREDEDARDAPRSLRFHLPGDIDGTADMEAGGVGGIPTNRAMVHLSLKF